MDSGHPIFDFETDFAGTLRCIPMCIRYQLDEIGIKLTLQLWNKFTSQERHQLVGLADNTPETQAAFTHRLIELMVAHDTGELERQPPVPGAAWADGEPIPPRVLSYATALKLAPPSPAAWASLSPLQRFALLKLTRSGHDNDNFIPAMREFGLLT